MSLFVVSSSPGLWNELEESLTSYEHNLTPDGKLDGELLGNMNVLFQEHQTGTYSPNCVFIELGQDVHSTSIENGSRKEFYHNCFVKSGNCSFDNYAKARYSLDDQLLDEIEDKIHTTLEKCSNPQGLVFTNAAFDGTGSGLPALILGFDISFCIKCLDKV